MNLDMLRENPYIREKKYDNTSSLLTSIFTDNIFSFSPLLIARTLCGFICLTGSVKS